MDTLGNFFLELFSRGLVSSPARKRESCVVACKKKVFLPFGMNKSCLLVKLFSKARICLPVFVFHFTPLWNICCIYELYVEIGLYMQYIFTCNSNFPFFFTDNTPTVLMSSVSQS